MLILNPDCELLPGSIAVLHAELDRYPDCVVVGPRVVDPDGTIQGSARGDPTMFTGLFGRSSLLTRRFPRSPLAKQNIRTPPRWSPATLVSSSTGLPGRACWRDEKHWMRSAAFDERFFLYWEDADLCRRLRARGGQIRYMPGTTIVHRVGGSTEKAPMLAIRAFHASAYLYYTTHVARSPFNPARWFAKLLLWFRYEWLLRRAER